MKELKQLSAEKTNNLQQMKRKSHCTTSNSCEEIPISMFGKRFLNFLYIVYVNVIVQ